MLSFRQISRAYSYIFVIAVYLPIISLMVLSFNNSRTVSYPFREFTLKWWKLFFSDPGATSTLKNSLVAASVTAVIATLMGLGIAFVLTRRRFSGKSALLYALTVPIAVPYIIIATSLFLIFSQVLNIPVNIYTLIMGHILVALPYSTLVIMARLIGFDRSLEEAAQDLGATGFTVFRKITLPLIMPGIVSSLYMTFIISLEDVVLARFLSGPNITVPFFVYGRLRRFEGLLETMALSSLMAILMLSLTLFYFVKAAKVEE
ncbi:hypothetical protein DRO69_07325 [Candidatus Bathyarchaeota archaeon]|nr:MAG: hypothetical protein DRO69_07325 [Candidatus Bathyarchaeota archaeon]